MGSPWLPYVCTLPLTDNQISDHLTISSDTVAVRSLTGANTASPTMTPATCAAFCSDFEYAGLEYGAECCKNLFPFSL